MNNIEFIQFDYKNTRPERDEYVIVQDFFESVNVQNAEIDGPSRLLSVEEALFLTSSKNYDHAVQPIKPWKMQTNI